MSDSYIRSLPGMVKGADNQKTDVLKLLQLEGVVPRVDPALARGYASPPLATVRIGDDYYDAAAVLGAIGGALGSVTQIDTASGNPAELDSPHAHIAQALVTTITPAQPGENYPAPDNVRPLTGWNVVNLYRGAAYDEAASPVLTAALPETVYGGTLDWTTGVLTVTHRMLRLTGSSAEGWTSNGSGHYYAKRYLTDTPGGDSTTDGYCTHYRYANAYAGIAKSMQGRETHVWLKDADLTSVDAVKAYLAEQAAAGTPVTLVYPLATPYAIQLNPQTLPLLLGSNAVWCDAGETAVTYAASGLALLEKRVEALEAAALAMGANI